MEGHEEDELEDLHSTIYTFPPNVQNVIEQVLPSTDPLDQPNFNVVDYINSLFPTEQSLSNIDDVVNNMELKICNIDKEIRSVVRGQTNVGQDGKAALEDAQKVIKKLFVHIKDIKDKAEQSEEVVKEITRDIKQLDFAKRNLTASITALNHLHMLVEGVDTLKVLTQKKQYGEIVLPLQAVMEVMQHFSSYMDIPQVKQLSDEVRQIHIELAQQITADFKQAFSGQNPKYFSQLTEGCLVLSVLDPKVKKDLLTWFVGIQLQEYAHLFDENQDFAWLDKIDRRYAWIKKHLLDFESKFGTIFPQDWEISERIAVQFCHVTREDLTKLMHKRRSEIDVKLLLYAIQRTSNFESLLTKRFSGITLENVDITNKRITTADTTDNKVPGNPFEQNDQVQNEKPKPSPFSNLIGKCFEPYLNIYIESLDRNLADLMDKFISDSKTQPPGAKDFDGIEGPSSVLSSCADLFVFYKKCMLQCTQLSTGSIMLSLAETFQKYLREYALKILQNNLPKIGGGTGIGTSMSSIRDFRDLSTSGFIQNFQSFLKEGESTRFSKEEQSRICCILTTAEYCLETTQQLEEKLREKTDRCYSEKINLSQEQDIFHNVISNCIQLLVQDLESACESALTAMTKVQWSAIEVVGDQSNYVNTIVAHLRQTIPTIRDKLSSCRKYFTQLCVKFASSFIVKLVQQLYKCKPLNTVGAEQLLLDVHMLKTALLDLPSTGYQVQRKAPATYTKVVVKGMASAEMILKIVMSPIESPKEFVKQCRIRLPDLQAPEFQKILDMKGLKKTEQVLLLEQFKQPENTDISHDTRSHIIQDSPEHEAGRIKRLEKLIKKRI
ncbi:vacuolar protein sorting-associated protein 53 homolog [Bombus vosnesenskii]|uniref:Vacuolar protein sorting-associated protein 53 homolog n=4 Tax=Pyrobombus TaxID=144703 RepID=A0A6J3LFM4_9HYME|nr:vacuolar protein sorting-associated protein 53 homolog [Bombus impatiens]XP_033202574.1 vacuolar protein sorting-associated protein 53 homolog [Bombus vancouverensis nearcticus]XP_033318607.1 vacuolar protein sorting-associated protein 53 homolog [Bombus bifarius]XP_033364157.1 vacuolar protein sorting-associated protein 53 homolog [Bombus vosnesenskii]XP_050490251.1 vacuolar protein sorting-associated protein 53 homolog [Bombus huntii]